MDKIDNTNDGTTEENGIKEGYTKITRKEELLNIFYKNKDLSLCIPFSSICSCKLLREVRTLKKSPNITKEHTNKGIISPLYSSHKELKTNEVIQ